MTFSKLFLLPICASTLLLGAYSSAANSGPPSYYDVPKIVEDKIVDLEDQGDVVGRGNCSNKNIYLFPPKPGHTTSVFSERYIGTWIPFDRFYSTLKNAYPEDAPQKSFVEKEVFKDCRYRYFGHI